MTVKHNIGIGIDADASFKPCTARIKDIDYVIHNTS